MNNNDKNKMAPQKCCDKCKDKCRKACIKGHTGCCSCHKSEKDMAKKGCKC